MRVLVPWGYDERIFLPFSVLCIVNTVQNQNTCPNLCFFVQYIWSEDSALPTEHSDICGGGIKQGDDIT